jgi:hypothetical protein
MDHLWESFFEERPRRKIEELGGGEKTGKGRERGKLPLH